MNANSEFRVGDRVVANTASFGTVKGSVVKIVFGDYLHIRSEANGCLYGVHENACRPATDPSLAHDQGEDEKSLTLKRLLRLSAEIW